jgi:hypothetical protein
VDYHYDDNLHKHIKRRQTSRVIVVSLFLVFLGIGGYILWDGLTNTSTSSTGTEQTVTKILGSQVERQVFETDSYSFETDLSWQKVDLPFEYRGYNASTYRSYSDAGLSLREFTIFEDTIPTDEELTYVLPVEIVDESTIEPLQISPRCNQLLDDQDSNISQQTEWAGANFICDPDRGSYILGTSHNSTGYSLEFVGQETGKQRSFFILYEDVEPTPRVQTFVNILRSFRVK